MRIFSVLLALLVFCMAYRADAQRDTTRFDKLVFMITPTTMLNSRIPSFEMGMEYNPKGHWGYGVNYGFAVWDKSDRLFNNQTHNLLRLDLKHYRKRQINATYTALELMLFQINHNGDGVNYLGSKNDQNLPVVRATFNEFNWKISLKAGRRISLDVLRMEWFLGVGIQQRNIWYQVNEVTTKIDSYPAEMCMMFRCKENFYLSDLRGFINGGFDPNVSFGLKLGFVSKTKSKTHP
jgi:hypothetical protein